MSFIITALISLFLVLQPGNAAAANSDLTAREFFQDLPCSIFESTVEGLSAPERDTLLRQGFSENWEISGEDKDLLVFSSIPFSDTIVALRLFYNDKDDSVIGIIGTVGAPICVLEAWKGTKTDARLSQISRTNRTRGNFWPGAKSSPQVSSLPSRFALD